MHHTVNEQDARTLEERIDAAIAAGIRQGREMSMRRRIRGRRRIGGAAAVCLLLFACVFTIRVFPVFAALVRDIPGLEKFVDLINDSYDQGIKLAVDNDFMQPVGVSDEHDGVKLTVQGIVADESRMVVFYEIRSSGQQEIFQFVSTDVTDMTGKPLQAAIGFNYPDEMKQDMRKTGIQRGAIDISLSQGLQLADQVILKMKLKGSGLAASSGPPTAIKAGSAESLRVDPLQTAGAEYRVVIPIDRARFAGLRREFAIGQTVEAEGQSVTFTKAVISPLRVALYMEYGANNTKQIFGPGDIRLVDDKGNVWKTISGSLGPDRNRPVYHFESPYFSEPKSLSVEGNWFRALDKDKLTVTLDTDKQRVIQAPDDKLWVHEVIKSKTHTTLDLGLDGLDPADTMMYSLLQDEFKDASGKTYKMPAVSESTGGYMEAGGPQHAIFYLKNESYKQPLTFALHDYPGYVRGHYRIRIK